jgi:hypothetical protein
VPGPAAPWTPTRGAVEEARLVRQSVAIACAQPDARAAVLRRELNDHLRFHDRDIRPHVQPAVNARADQLARSVRAEIEAGTSDGFDMADSLNAQLNALYWNEGMRLPQFCTQYWRWAREERYLMRDKARFDSVREAGDAQLAAGDMAGLRDSLRAMWDNKVSTGRQRNVTAPADVLRE